MKFLDCVIIYIKLFTYISAARILSKIYLESTVHKIGLQHHCKSEQLRVSNIPLIRLYDFIY